MAVTWRGSVDSLDAGAWPVRLFRTGDVAVVTGAMGRPGPALRFSVGPDSHPPQLADNRRRAQVGTGHEAHDELGLQRGGEAFIRVLFGFPVESQWVREPAGKRVPLTYNVLWEMQRAGHHTVSNFGMGVDRETGDLALNVNGGGVERNADDAKRKWVLIPAAQLVGWRDVVVRLRAGDRKRGLVQVWVDGREVVPLTRTGTLWDGDTGLHPNFGIYQGEATGHLEQSLLFIGAIERASSGRDFGL